ncbi:type III-B CRISPR module RAMP protein Cmr6 [Accumulibacter sp.]|uniref:type III-B CRISPR module RAMP protein Cmr6 n=1 Tax=Accumulibacter sp. TaxID=2053492 RepID=UPI0025CFC1E3|nr:type III-B CRISPR module RAMP protein Cmr6 [Accumulibacter sp.]MCM8611179.1 type III-B CRISPR module RAMP protein Cmr6 [Accumulibacter sp.]MCM8634325.1 type III-B CRISPR module RAMP protein Cmr6 [Accumulibacter sp.]MCM8641643.1 type III-B CRISPR module RAMP protein Cmr6 [Accumulibacter sp.]
MPIAAVPAYLGSDFSEASPAMRFGMYLKLWGINRRTHATLWSTQDLDYEVRGQNREEREVPKENKVAALAEARGLRQRDRQAMTALATRQSLVAATLPAASLLRLDAFAQAPFTTGLGNEHPLENGFAFLSPYGLPYLPGSGVKGVLRQAARELASGEWGEPHGWSEDQTFVLNAGKQRIRLSLLDALFGLESGDGDSEHVRGALAFWDVIPQIKGDSLMVEIMTPHQSHYYQQKRDRRTGDSTTPHDSGQPTPISFLTVPPGSTFTFFVTCDQSHLQQMAPQLTAADPDSGKPRWHELMTKAFEHAFAWLGFGAKTAVGYGAMASEAMRQARRPPAEPRPEGDQDSIGEAETVPWSGARLKYNQRNGTLSAEKDGKAAHAHGEKGKALLASLPSELRRKVEGNQFCKVTAHVSGSVLVRAESG